VIEPFDVSNEELEKTRFFDEFDEKIQTLKPSELIELQKLKEDEFRVARLSGRQQVDYVSTAESRSSQQCGDMSNLFNNNNNNWSSRKNLFNIAESDTAGCGLFETTAAARLKDGSHDKLENSDAVCLRESANSDFVVNEQEIKHDNVQNSDLLVEDTSSSKLGLFIEEISRSSSASATNNYNQISSEESSDNKLFISELALDNLAPPNNLSARWPTSNNSVNATRGLDDNNVLKIVETKSYKTEVKILNKPRVEENSSVIQKKNNNELNNNNNNISVVTKSAADLSQNNFANSAGVEYRHFEKSSSCESFETVVEKSSNRSSLERAVITKSGDFSSETLNENHDEMDRRRKTAEAELTHSDLNNNTISHPISSSELADLEEQKSQAISFGGNFNVADRIQDEIYENTTVRTKKMSLHYPIHSEITEPSSSSCSLIPEMSAQYPLVKEELDYSGLEPPRIDSYDNLSKMVYYTNEMHLLESEVVNLEMFEGPRAELASISEESDSLGNTPDNSAYKLNEMSSVIRDVMESRISASSLLSGNDPVDVYDNLKIAVGSFEINELIKELSLSKDDGDFVEEKPESYDNLARIGESEAAVKSSSSIDSIELKLNEIRQYDPINFSSYKPNYADPSGKGQTQDDMSNSCNLTSVDDESSEVAKSKSVGSFVSQKVSRVDLRNYEYVQSPLDQSFNTDELGDLSITENSGEDFVEHNMTAEVNREYDEHGNDQIVQTSHVIELSRSRLNLSEIESNANEPELDKSYRETELLELGDSFEVPTTILSDQRSPIKLNQADFSNEVTTEQVELIEYKIVYEAASQSNTESFINPASAIKSSSSSFLNYPKQREQVHDGEFETTDLDNQDAMLDTCGILNSSFDEHELDNIVYRDFVRVVEEDSDLINQDLDQSDATAHGGEEFYTVQVDIKDKSEFDIISTEEIQEKEIADVDLEREKEVLNSSFTSDDLHKNNEAPIAVEEASTDLKEEAVQLEIDIDARRKRLYEVHIFLPLIEQESEENSDKDELKPDQKEDENTVKSGDLLALKTSTENYPESAQQNVSADVDRYYDETDLDQIIHAYNLRSITEIPEEETEVQENESIDPCREEVEASSALINSVQFDSEENNDTNTLYKETENPELDESSKEEISESESPTDQLIAKKLNIDKEIIVSQNETENVIELVDLNIIPIISSELAGQSVAAEIDQYYDENELDHIIHAYNSRSISEISENMIDLNEINSDDQNLEAADEFSNSMINPSQSETVSYPEKSNTETESENIADSFKNKTMFSPNESEIKPNQDDAHNVRFEFAIENKESAQPLESVPVYDNQIVGVDCETANNTEQYSEDNLNNSNSSYTSDDLRKITDLQVYEESQTFSESVNNNNTISQNVDDLRKSFDETERAELDEDNSNKNESRLVEPSETENVIEPDDLSEASVESYDSYFKRPSQNVNQTSELDELTVERLEIIENLDHRHSQIEFDRGRLDLKNNQNPFDEIIESNSEKIDVAAVCENVETADKERLILPVDFENKDNVVASEITDNKNETIIEGTTNLVTSEAVGLRQRSMHSIEKENRNSDASTKSYTTEELNEMGQFFTFPTTQFNETKNDELELDTSFHEATATKNESFATKNSDSGKSKCGFTKI
jgi:hypothetical protein